MVWVKEKQNVGNIIKESPNIDFIKELRQKAENKIDFEHPFAFKDHEFDDPQPEQEFKEKESRDELRNRLLKKSGVEI